MDERACTCVGKRHAQYRFDALRITGTAPHYNTHTWLLNKCTLSPADDLVHGICEQHHFGQPTRLLPSPNIHLTCISSISKCQLHQFHPSHQSDTPTLYIIHPPQIVCIRAWYYNEIRISQKNGKSLVTAGTHARTYSLTTLGVRNEHTPNEWYTWL